MKRQSKEQQRQFFRDVLLPQLDVPADLIDLRALIDGDLSTFENWQENVKPRAERLVDRIYLTKKELKAEIERYEAMQAST
jgi:hypothetical protein